MNKNAIKWSIIAGALVILIVGATILYNSLSKEYKANNIVVLSSSQNEVAANESSEEATSSEQVTSSEKTTTTSTEKTSSNNKVSSTNKTSSTPKNSSQVKSSSEIATSSEEFIVEPKVFDFTVVDANGKDVKLSDFVGKPIVLNFWTSWCGYCKKEMPDFEKAAKNYPDVNFLMVNVTCDKRETEELAKKYIADTNYDLNFYFDIYKDAVAEYGVRSYPTTYFLDSKGGVVSYSAGSLDYDGLVDCIEMVQSAK